MPENHLPLTYGAANVGNLHRVLTDDEANAILEAAWDAGIRAYDTAPHYGLGLSEIRLGKFLRNKPRDEFTLSTKVGRLIRPNPSDDGGLDTANGFHVRTTSHRVWDFSDAGINASLDESRARLGMDRIDIVYLHDPERYDLDAAAGEAMSALSELRRSGAVGRIGVGSMSTAALERAAEDARVDLLMVAGRYTLLEQPAGEKVLPACRRNGIGVVAASVFNSGLLSRPRPAASARYEYGDVPTAVRERLERILRVCDAHDVPLPAAALQYLERNPVVEAIVVGASSGSQIAQSVEYLNVDIPAEFWREMADSGLA